MTRRRVVVTGIGLVTPCGTGVEPTWAALVRGESGAGPITRFDASRLATRIAAEVRDFDPDAYLDRKEQRRLDRFEQYAVAAADMALADAGLRITPGNGERVGAVVGSSFGGIESLEAAHRAALERGPERINPFLILQLLANLAPGYITIRHGIKGPSWSTSSACATGAHAIGEAMRAIERGDVDAVLAGAAEAPITLLGVGGFSAIKALSTRNEDPKGASRPFAADRDGFVLAEGAGILVLEARDHARARGARILAEAAGYGATSDAHHVTSPAPGHEGAERAMRLALADSGLPPSAVGYVNAHATSTEVGDRLEMEAVGRVFGAGSRVAVSSTKSMTGHMNAAAGSAEAAIAILALVRSVIPPTINLHRQDPAITVDCVPNRAREAGLEAVLSNSFGFGGTNATLLFRRDDGR